MSPRSPIPSELAHSSGATVAYEPGFTDRMLLDDTPVNIGTDVTVWVQFGAHGHPDGNTYRISVLAPLNNGTVIEEERDLKVDRACAGGDENDPGRRHC